MDAANATGAKQGYFFHGVGFQEMSVRVGGEVESKVGNKNLMILRKRNIFIGFILTRNIFLFTETVDKIFHRLRRLRVCCLTALS
jgi:hypothetical protein